MTKNQIEYTLGMSQLQQRAAELELERNKYRDQAAYDYGVIYDDHGNWQGYQPDIAIGRKKDLASIAKMEQEAKKAGSDERYGGGALGDVRRGIESIFPFLQTYRNIYGE